MTGMNGMDIPSFRRELHARKTASNLAGGSLDEDLQNPSARRSTLPRTLLIGVCLSGAIYAGMVYLIGDIGGGTSAKPAIVSESLAPAPQTRVVSEDDFLWSERTSRHKAMIVSATNHLIANDRRCAELHPLLVELSPQKSRPGDPVFYAGCESSSEAS